eukprot:gene40913-54176_t
MANTNSGSSLNSPCSFFVPAGTTFSVTPHSKNAYSSLYNGDGVYLSEGRNYSFSTTVGQYYNLKGGCVSRTYCRNRYIVSGALVSPSPTVSPSGPSPAPSQISNGQLSCGPYTSTNGQLITCEFVACSGSTISIPCSNCVGDTYLYLYNSEKALVAYNDDSCGLCSRIEYVTPVDGKCRTYFLKQGCYGGDTCSGDYTITGFRNASSLTPTHSPSIQPSTKFVICDGYEFSSYTNYAYYYWKDCSFIACPGTSLFFEDNLKSGYTYARLYNSNGIQLTEGNTISYTTMEECQTYNLHQGCYGWSGCSGKYVIYGGIAVPTIESTVAPTVTSTTSTPTTLPSIAPTVPTSVPTTSPTFSTYFNCTPYQVSGSYYTNYAYVECLFYACPKTLLRIALSPGSDVTAYFYLYGAVNGYTTQGFGDVFYTTPSYSVCQTYHLRQGCSTYSTCRANYIVYGAVPSPSAEPTALPSNPSAEPTSQPSVICPEYTSSNSNS